MRGRAWNASALLVALAPGLGCAAGADTIGAEVGPSGGGDLLGPGTCAAGQIVCEGSIARTCDGEGGLQGSRDCAPDGKECAPGYGCVDCVPFSEGSCKDGVATMCDARGAGAVSFACDAEQGMTCAPDGCHGACSPMELHGSYIGCDYWPTVTWNGTLSTWFHFAAAIANASSEVANVKVTRGDETIASAVIAPGSLEILELPWVPELKGEDSGSGVLIAMPTKSVRANAGAYRLRTDKPVSVYQFNALQYQNIDAPVSPTCMDATKCCPDPTNAGGCFSYSNDASMLLPATVLTSNYAVLGYRTVTSGLAGMYDSMAITATQDGTEVAFLASTYTAPGGGLEAVAPGQIGSATLDAGDVLQVLSSGVSLSGTRVWSPNGRPLQLLAAMPAAEIVEGVHAADHIEEIVLPIEALGRDYVVSAPTTPLGKRIHTARIQPVVDGTTLHFDPPGVHAEVTLAAWESLEIAGADGDFRVWSDQPFGVTQYMHGQGLGPQQEGAAGAGDPSQGLAIPTQQFRKRYVFLAPADYDTNWLNVTAPMGAKVMLDGVEVPADELESVGASGLAVARHLLDDREFHEIESSVPFGIVVYGYGSYTSYMVPGGLDVKHISDVPLPK